MSLIDAVAHRAVKTLRQSVQVLGKHPEIGRRFTELRWPPDVSTRFGPARNPGKSATPASR
jgi:plasmid stabilization system protein ParE